MKDFKSLPKMKCGGQVKKFESGGSTSSDRKPFENTRQAENRSLRNGTYDSELSRADKFAESVKSRLEKKGASVRGGSMTDSQIKEQLGSRNPTFKRGGKVKK